MAVTFLFRPPTTQGNAAKPVAIRFEGDSVQIGRRAAADLRLPHESVSEDHAALRREADGWQLVDTGSRNGTWVNGVRLLSKASRTVHDGDLVRVGAVWLELRIESVSAPAVDARTTREIALDIVSKCLAAPDAPTVVIVEGPDAGSQLVLKEVGRAYSLGRSSRCDLALMDIDVSREHVRVTRRGGDVVVSDVMAKNGVVLGDDRLAASSSTPWPPALAVRIGGTVLALRMPMPLEAMLAPGDEDEATAATGAQAPVSLPVAPPSAAKSDPQPSLRTEPPAPSAPMAVAPVAPASPVVAASPTLPRKATVLVAVAAAALFMGLIWGLWVILG